MREYAGICMKRNLGIRMRGNMVRGIWEGICMRGNMGICMIDTDRELFLSCTI